MSPTLVKLVAALLLIVQGVVGLAPGRVLCIGLQDCGGHVHAHSHGQELGHGHAMGMGQGHCHEDEDQPRGVVIHEHGECGCHVHVAVPDEDVLPGKSWNERAEVQAVCVPVLHEVTVWVGDGPSLVSSERWRPPDRVSVFASCDQVRGMKCTRLLV